MSRFFSATRQIFVKLLSLILLACIIMLGSGFLLSYCTRDTSPVVPLSQNGQKLKTPGIISPEGDLLLPVQGICSNNYYVCQLTELKSKNNMIATYTLLILADNKSEPGIAISYNVDAAGNGSQMAVVKGGETISTPEDFRLYKGELYLPVSFFNEVFALNVELSEDGKGTIVSGTAAEAAPDSSNSQEPTTESAE